MQNDTMRLTAQLCLILALSGCFTDIPPSREPFIQPWQAVSDGILFPDLTLEIHHAEGNAPHDEAVSQTLSEFAKATARSDIGIAGPYAHAAPSGPWTTTALVSLSQEWTGRERPYQVAQGEAVIPVLYLPDSDEQGASGLYVHTGLVVMFPETFRGWFGPVQIGGGGIESTSDGPLERLVLLHELGHAAGLVGCHLPMTFVRHDPEHPCHSVNQHSVMHWTFEQPSTLESLGIEEHEEVGFDRHDLADLRAWRQRTS